jgi:ABC-type branched-subunit amino acid transport system substrate-binding protein
MRKEDTESQASSHEIEPGQSSPYEASNAAGSVAMSVNSNLENLEQLVRHRKWFDLLVSLGVIFFLLFDPGGGPLYKGPEYLTTKITQNEGLYPVIFSGVIFLLFMLYLLLKAYEIFQKSGTKIRFIVAVSMIVLVLAFSTSVAQESSFSLTLQPIDDDISWGEESLLDKYGPESTIFKSNLAAVKRSSGFFDHPLKVAVSLPISRDKGTFQAEEVLMGIAIAQEEWNKGEENGKTQMVVAIADDGYKLPSEEKNAAITTAEKILEDEKVLGVIGHFSSAATAAAAEKYKPKKVILISPTSTAVRCPEGEENSESNDSEKCLGLNPYIFRTSLNDEEMVGILESFLKGDDSKIEKIAVVYESEDDYSKLYRRSFIERVEERKKKNKESGTSGEVIEVLNANALEWDSDGDKCNISSTNFSAKGCLDDAKGGSANALLLIPSTKNSVKIEEILQENYSNLDFQFRLLGSDSMYQENFIEINGKAREVTVNPSMKLSIPLTWHRSEESCPINATARLECQARIIFKNKYSEFNEEEEFSPLPISWRTKTGYDAAEILFDSIDRTVKKECSWHRYIEPIWHLPAYRIN